MIGWLERECADLTRIASFYKKHGKLSQAENSYRLIVAMREKNYDIDSLELGIAYYSLASVLADKSEFEGAKPLFRKAVEIYQKHDRSRMDNPLWYCDTLADLQALADENLDSDETEPSQREA
jgi:hypothetical protein